MMMKLSLLFIITLTALYGNDKSYNRGEMLYFSKVCNGCHGPSAEGGSSAPRLANRKQAYLIKKLLSFRSGKASSQSQEIMVQFAVKLSEEEIEKLSYFLSHHKAKRSEDVSSELLGGFGS